MSTVKAVACGSNSQCASAPYTLIYDPATGHNNPSDQMTFASYAPISPQDGATLVNLNDWSPVSGMTNTAYVIDPGHWSAWVSANNPAGNVLLYTSTGSFYNGELLSQYSSIISSFDVTLPPDSVGGTGWNGYDIWLNNWADEIMIQTVWHHNPYPCTSVETATFGGSNGVPVNSWGLCVFGSEKIWGLNSAMGPQATALTVDIKAMIQWLIDHGYITTQASTLTAVGFGFEVTNTGGALVGPWSVNSFSYTMK
jgi:hypothetical protein